MALRIYYILIFTLVLSPVSCLNKSDNAMVNAETDDKELYDKPIDSDRLLSYQSGCSNANDCTYANNGACDCANGGIETAVMKAKYEEFVGLFKKNVACTERAKVPPCGTGTTSCIDSRCNFEPEKSHVKLEFSP